MKNSKLFLVTSLLTLVLITNRFAGPSQASKNETSIYKQIERQMHYPEFAKKEQVNGKVTVEFKFKENGHIEILNLNYSDKNLKSYVVDQLTKMNIQLPEGVSGKIYRIAFSFNLIS